MKTGISTGYINRYGLLAGLKKMREHGYECIDYNMADTLSGLYLHEGEELKNKAEELRREIEGASITVSQTHGPWRWPPRDFTVGDREERFEKMAKAIRITRLLGCSRFVIHPLMPFGFDSDPCPEKLWKMNAEFFKRLLPTAVGNDVVICLENMPMAALSISRPEDVLRFAKAMHSPNFKVCLDTGHCAVLGISPADAVRLLGREYLYALHVHDNDGVNDSHLIPYDGVIDWDGFSRALSDIGFDGCLSLETEVRGEMPDTERDKKERLLAKTALKLAGGRK